MKRMHRSKLLGGTAIFLTLICMPVASNGQSTPESLPDHVDRGSILVANVGLTAAFALARRTIEGEISTPSDVAETLTAGALAGYGFYHAKKRMGEQRYTSGMLLAFGSSSLTENVATGEHPLGYLRFGPGPVDFRLRTPAAKSEASLVTVEINPISMAALFALPLMDFSAETRGGTIQYRGAESLGNDGSHTRMGLSLGRVVVLASMASETVRAHEMIHYIQTMQVQSISPYPTLGALTGRAPLKTGSLLAWDLQLKHTLALTALLTSQFPYHERWTEIEAYTLQEELETDVSPVCPPGTICLLSKPN